MVKYNFCIFHYVVVELVLPIAAVNLKKKKRFSKLLNIKKWNRSVYSLLFALHVGLFWSEKYLRN